MAQTLKKRESNSLCLFVFSSSFFLCYCCCYSFMGGRQSSVLSHVCNSYHGSLPCSPSKYVDDVRKSKRKKKGRWMDRLVCIMHMCEHVYINIYTCMYKKGKRWVSKDTQFWHVLCMCMYKVHKKGEFYFSCPVSLQFYENLPEPTHIFQYK